MAVFTVTINSYDNLPPNQIGNKEIGLTYNQTYIFAETDFTETVPSYSDPEGDSVSIVKIVTIPTQGVLYLSGVPVVALDEIPIVSITGGLLTYEADAANENGYTNSELTFDLADSGSSTFSGLTPGIITFIVEAKDNEPPTIGDGSATIDYGETLVFTRVMFTSSTTPPYSDPEGDAAGLLKILTLPLLGDILLDGVPVTINQVISFTDIDAGLLTYVPDLADTDGDLQGFTFAIADEGSGIFVE